VLAPTVRIGAIYSAGRDFRLALGTDFWRSDTRGTLFVSGVLTPRGGSLFAGVRLRLGFSAGRGNHPQTHLRRSVLALRAVGRVFEQRVKFGV
jgi:hypothetical protein